MNTKPSEDHEPARSGEKNERRKAARRSVVDSHLVTVDLAFQSGALLLDLSETGMGVQALASAPTGTTTPIHFELPETGGRIDGIGRIAWTDSSGRVGIRFEKLAEESRLSLAQWLSRNRRRLVAPGPVITMPSWPPPHMRDEIAALRRDLTVERLQGDAALTLVVERTRNITRATGAVIALQRDGHIVCCASSGNAPGIGARVDPNSGLSGECVRTGEIVRCEDTETDPRADRLVCRRLELRAMVIVPVRVQGRAVGLVEVFSSRPHAFQSSDVLMLRRISEVVAGITACQPLQSTAPAGEDELMAALLDPFLPEPQAEPALPLVLDPTVSPDIDVAPLPPVPASDAVPTPAVERTSAQTTTTVSPVEVTTRMASGAAPAIPEKVVPAASSVSAPQLLKPLAEAAAAAVTVRVPAPSPPLAEKQDGIFPRVVPAGQEVNELSPHPVPHEVMSQTVTAAQARPRGGRIVGAAVLIVALGISGWQLWRVFAARGGKLIGNAVDRALPVASPPANIPAPPPTMTNSTAVSATPAAAPPQMPATPPPAGTAEKPATGTAVEVALEEELPGRITVPAPNMTKAQLQAEASETPSPLSLGSRSDPSAIANVVQPSAIAPTLAAPQVSQLSGGKLLKKYDPAYPAAAAGLSGEVLLKASIDREGKVAAVQVINGRPPLADAAVKAVRRWRYEPFLLNGSPIEVEITILVKFKAPGR